MDGGQVAPGRAVTEEFPLAEAQRAFKASRVAPGKTWVRIAADP